MSVLKRIDHAQVGEAPEIGIGGADLGDPVLAHQRNGVEIMHDVARERGVFLDQIGHDCGMPFGFRQYIEIWRSKESIDETSGLLEGQRIPKSTMGDNTKEFVEHGPGREPALRSFSPFPDQMVGSGVFRRSLIGGMDQYVRVNHEHAYSSSRPSNIQGNLSRSSDSNQASLSLMSMDDGPRSNVGSGGSSFGTGFSVSPR